MKRQRMTKRKFLEYYYSPNRPMDKVEKYLDYALKHFELIEARSYIAEWLKYVFYRTKHVNGKVKPEDIDDIISNTWLAISKQIERGNYKKKSKTKNAKPSSWLLTILRINTQNFIRDEYYTFSEEDEIEEEMDEHVPVYCEDIGTETQIGMGEDPNMILSFVDYSDLLPPQLRNDATLAGLQYYLIKIINERFIPYIKSFCGGNSLQININSTKLVNNFFVEYSAIFNSYVENKLKKMEKETEKKPKRIRNKKTYRQFFITYLLSHLPENIKQKIYKKLDEKQMDVKKFIQELEQECFAKEDVYRFLYDRIYNTLKNRLKTQKIVREIMQEFPNLTIHNLFKYRQKITLFIKKKYNISVKMWKKGRVDKTRIIKYNKN